MAKIIISHCLFLSGRIINILIITIFGVARGQSGYDNLNLLLRKIRSIISPTPYQLVLPPCYFVFLPYFGFKQKTVLCLTSECQVFTFWPLYIHDKYFYIYSCSFCLPFVLAFIAEIFFGLQGMSSGIYWDLIVSYNSSFHGHSSGIFSNVAYCVGEDPNLNVPPAPGGDINLDQVVDNPGSEKKRGLSEGEDTAQHSPRKRARLSINVDAGSNANECPSPINTFKSHLVQNNQQGMPSPASEVSTPGARFSPGDYLFFEEFNKGDVGTTKPPAPLAVDSASNKNLHVPFGSFTDVVVQDIITYRENYGEFIKKAPKDSIIAIHPLTITMFSDCGGEVISSCVAASHVKECSEKLLNNFTYVNFSTQTSVNFPHRLLEGQFLVYHISDNSIVLLKNYVIENPKALKEKNILMRLARPSLKVKDHFIILLIFDPGTATYRNYVLEQYLFLENIGFIPLENHIIYSHENGKLKRYVKAHNQPLSESRRLEVKAEPMVILHNEKSLKFYLGEFEKHFKNK